MSFCLVSRALSSSLYTPWVSGYKIRSSHEVFHEIHGSLLSIGDKAWLRRQASSGEVPTANTRFPLVLVSFFQSFARRLDKTIIYIHVSFKHATGSDHNCLYQIGTMGHMAARSTLWVSNSVMVELILARHLIEGAGGWEKKCGPSTSLEPKWHQMAEVERVPPTTPLTC